MKSYCQDLSYINLTMHNQPPKYEIPRLLPKQPISLLLLLTVPLAKPWITTCLLLGISG